MGTSHAGTATEPIWAPDPATAAGSAIAGFARWAIAGGRCELADPLDYSGLWRWSVDDVDGFWRAVSDFFLVVDSTGLDSVLTGDGVADARWFEGTWLNFSEQLLRAGDADQVCAIWVREDGQRSTTTFGELRAEVAALAATLRRLGVGRGDRVVGYLPHTRHALVGFLAAASLGAIWSQCAPDYGGAAAVDRFGQLEPTLLIAVDGYRFAGKTHDRRAEVDRIVAGLPTLRHVVLADYVGLGWADRGLGDVDTITWSDAVAEPAELEIAQVPFGHPLWVLFTSGTTGLPKGIVHGHGGMLLQQRVFNQFQMGVGKQDVYLWYTTTNWVMWNIQVSALLGGSTIVAYDGNPTFPDVTRMWELVAECGVTVFGVSPGFLAASAKADLRPSESFDLRALRTIGSTGSILPAALYHWVGDRVGPTVALASVSGGTDIAGAFLASAPTTPIWPGEISAPALGAAVAAFDDRGRSVVDELGELVITRPLPSMPLGIWGDESGQRYRDAYFRSYDGVWRQGDWITVTPRGSVVMHGRSDATLNRKGVRLGSADIYEVVEELPEVLEALVIGVEQPDGGYWMPLFLVLSDGAELTDSLREKIVSALRTDASPRHVPDDIIVVPALPHTRTGKKLEVPIKRLFQGADPNSVVSIDAVDEPAALEFFIELAGCSPASRKSFTKIT